jgi:hypothetical protein
MHISAFVPTFRMSLEGGAVNATGVPQTRVPLRGKLPMRVNASILLCVWTEAGSDPNPCIYVQARDPSGAIRGNAEIAWAWDDVPDQPVKWQAWALSLPFWLSEPGVITFGVYNQPDDAETDHWFVMPITVDDA